MIRRLLIVLTLLSFACTSTPAATESVSVETTRPASVETTQPEAIPPVETTPATSTPPDTAQASNPTPGSCPSGTGVPWSASMTAAAEPLLSDGNLSVDAVVYPHPDYDGNPWSQWGQGLISTDGRFYSAIGDHFGENGNSYLYEYDPEAKELILIANVSEVLDQQPGSWGYGKVHAQMATGPCGIYVSTYWGTRRRLAFDDHYQGDHLLLLDTTTRQVSDLSVILPEHGVPSLASSPDHGLIYAEAVDPFIDPNTGWFVVLDQEGHEVFRTDTTHVGFRSMAVDAQGRAFFSIGDGELGVYDPAANEVTTSIGGLPGEWLRAATVPGPDGTLYGVTREPDRLFALGPDGDVRDLGPVAGYTTSLAMSPDGTTLYYVPYAHGGSSREDTPLISVDTSTGQQTVVAHLNPAAEEKLGLTLGGSYNLAMDPDGGTLYVGMNAGAVGSGETFGTVVLLIVHLDS